MQAQIAQLLAAQAQPANPFGNDVPNVFTAPINADIEPKRRGRPPKAKEVAQ
jgi:hypothetical protein